jgi:hypothetical protein
MAEDGREYSLAVDGRTTVARRRGRAAGEDYRRPLARRDPKASVVSVGYRAVKLPGRVAFALAVKKSLIALTTPGASGKLASE